MASMGQAGRISLLLGFSIWLCSFSSAAYGAVSNMEWSDWDGRQVCYPSKYLQPKTEAEIVSVVRKANENGNQIKVVGSGHSFSSITLTSNDRPNAILLNLDNFKF